VDDLGEPGDGAAQTSEIRNIIYPKKGAEAPFSLLSMDSFLMLNQ
jgi:hypothetical protein